MKKTDEKYLQHSFLRMLEAGEYTWTDSEMDRICAELKLPLHGQSVFCLVVRSSEAEKDIEKIIRIKCCCEKTMEALNWDGYVLVGDNMDSIMILTEYEKYSYQDFQHFHKTISHYLGFPVRLGVGKGRNELSRLVDSKNEAYEALMYVGNSMPVADVRDLYKVRNIPMVSTTRKSREIVEKFKKGDLDNIENDLSDLAEVVRSNTTVKKDTPYPTSIRRTMVELLVHLMQSASDAGVDVDLELDFVDPYRKIFEFKETPSIIHWIVEVAQILANAMSVRQERLENNMLYQIKSFIEENISNVELSLISISQSVDMSPSYISAFFIKEMGLGFKEYVTTKRIDMARKLLDESKDSVDIISEKCGFLTSSYFIRVFKAQTGMTPGAYRRKK